jgi:hypothetical protein
LAAEEATGGELSPWWRMGHNLNQNQAHIVHLSETVPPTLYSRSEIGRRAR